MGKRRKARESTLQILFQLEFNDSQPKKTLDQYWKYRRASKDVKEYIHSLVEGILSHQEEIDKIIQSVSEHWRISRMAVVDRNIIRIAVYELLYEENIDAAVIINEAIEIAKKYSNEKSATFVNGLLDAVKKKIETKGKID